MDTWSNQHGGSAMPSNLQRLFALLLMLCAITSAHAQAFRFGGSFSGTVHAERLPLGFEPPHAASYYEGAPVSGTFEVHAPAPEFQTGSNDHAYFLNNHGGWLSITYKIKGENFDFLVKSNDLDASVILLQRPAAQNPTQSIFFATDFMPKYEGASFALSGPDGSLFDGLTVGTFHIDPDALPGFSTSFASSHASMRFSIGVNQATFQMSAVPEPSGTVFLIPMGIALVWARRR